MLLQSGASLAQGCEEHGFDECLLKERDLEKFEYRRDHKLFLQFMKRGHDVLAPFNGGLEGVWKPLFEHEQMNGCTPGQGFNHT